MLVKAWTAWRERGSRYLWHKTLRRSLGRWPGWKRRLLYADPRDYWTLRGGEEYFREQEDQPERTERALWLANRIASHGPTSILEIGCGYGKQLRAIRGQISVPMVGLDFSSSQIGLAVTYLDGLDQIDLVLGSGRELPFPDRSFDLVLTSAVILHNPPRAAERIRREVIRVARRYAAHNEDTDITYNRYGYDTSAWYRERGFSILESGPIPIGSRHGPSSQFCVAEVAPWPR
ncbi:MAG: hypothetical protein NVSMB9_08930 [Isosphaeraceae bacterium]